MIGDKPAFPVFPEGSVVHASAYKGLTIRQYMIIKIGAAMIGGGMFHEGFEKKFSEVVTRHVDALLEAM